MLSPFYIFNCTLKISYNIFRSKMKSSFNSVILSSCSNSNIQHTFIYFLFQGHIICDECHMKTGIEGGANNRELCHTCRMMYLGRPSVLESMLGLTSWGFIHPLIESLYFYVLYFVLYFNFTICIISFALTILSKNCELVNSFWNEFVVCFKSLA